MSLLDDVVKATQGSPTHSHPTFVNSVVKAYKTLRCSDECVAHIRKIIENDYFRRLRKNTLKEVLEAARVTQAHELSRDIQMLL
jgi:alpha-ketoglutarate-dependent taurine dioxygenase